MRVNHTKTPYEICYVRSPTTKYFKTFGRKFYIRGDEEDLGNFGARVNEQIFLGLYKEKGIIVLQHETEEDCGI